MVVVLALLVLAAWQVPPRLDWNRYRATLEVLASARLGTPVTINGRITLALLPEPVLVADAVSVGEDTSAAPSMRVQALRLRLALSPLLAGRIDATELRLHQPDLTVPWPVQAGLPGLRLPAWLAAFSAHIEDGRLRLGSLTLSHLDGTIASLETGELQVAAIAGIAATRWNIALHMTTPGPDGVSGITVTLDSQGKTQGTVVTFSGQADAAGRLAGRLSARGGALSLLLPAPPLHFSGQGSFTLADGLARLDDLTLMLGDVPASASVSWRMGNAAQVDIAFSTPRLELDPWVAQLFAPSSPTAPPIRVTLSADAAVVAGATLQDLHSQFRITPDALVLEQASAALPGDARLAVAGQIDRSTPAQPGFTGDAAVHAPVLRATLRGLHLDSTRLVAALPAGVLQRTDLRAHLVARAGQLSLTGLEGSIDDSQVAGNVTLRSGEPLGVAADLRFDRLALDPWQLGQFSGRYDTLARLARVDSSLHLAAQHVTLASADLQDAELDMATGAGGIELHRLAATALGAQIVASGALGPGGNVTNAKLSLTTGDATPLAALLPPDWHATPGLWQGPAALTLEAAGPPQALQTDLRLTLGGARLEAQPQLDLNTSTLRGTLTLRHPSAQLLLAELGLPVRLGLAGPPVWLGDGSLSLVTRLTMAPGPRLSADGIDLVAGELHAGGNLALDASGAEPRLTGAIRADALPLPWPEIGATPLPMALLHGWTAALRLDANQVMINSASVLHDAAAAVTLQNDRLNVARFSAKLGDGALSGEATLDAGATPPALTLTLGLTGVQIDAGAGGLPLDLHAGTLNGQAALNAAGYSTDALLASLSGEIQAELHNGTVSGFDLAQVEQAVGTADSPASVATLQAALRGGISGFDRLVLAAHVATGNLTLATADLTSAAGDAHASGTVALPSGEADLRIVLHPAIADPPELVLHLNGPIAAPRRTPELAGLARWRIEHSP